MDSGISNVFINAVTAINMKGLMIKLVYLILFVFFLNSAKCQQIPNCPPRDSCENTSDECSPSFCLSGPFCCFDGCRYICSSVCPPPGCTSNIDECYSTFCMTSPIGIGRCCFDGCRNVCRGIIN
ncbi:UNVERIFIED_CONTAM: hypothetical protein RMT77_011116 [Armadillidium vulgare]